MNKAAGEALGIITLEGQKMDLSTITNVYEKRILEYLIQYSSEPSKANA
jgi:hypothetical protein